MNRLSVFFRNIEISCISNEIQGPAIVFLHGNSLSSDSFKKQFEDPGLQDFRLIAIDLPGHGLSQTAINPQDDYNLFYFRDAVLHVIRHLKVENFLLAGHSLGGHIAMECLPFLDNCKGIMIWAAPPIRLPLNMAEIFLPNPSLSLLFKKDLDETDIMQLASILADENYLEEITAMIEQSDPRFREVLPLSLGNNMVSDEYRLLADSGIPVAILHGENDQLVNFDYYGQLTIPTLWKKRAIIVKNSTHTPQLESFNEFNERVLQFCSGVFKMNR